MDDLNADAKDAFRRIEVLTGPASALVGGREGADCGRDAGFGSLGRRWQVCSQQVFTWRRGSRAGHLALSLEAVTSHETSFVPRLLQLIANFGGPPAGVHVDRAQPCQQGAERNSSALPQHPTRGISEIERKSRNPRDLCANSSPCRQPIFRSSLLAAARGWPPPGWASAVVARPSADVARHWRRTDRRRLLPRSLGPEPLASLPCPP
jgi:hypothetical protein